MKTETVSVATLKQNLSAYLHKVEQGAEVLVTSHRRPVARIVSGKDAGTIIRTATLPLSALRKVRGITPLKPFSAVQALLDDRARR